MGLLKNLISGMGKNRKEFKEKFKQAEEEFRVQKMVEDRQKSANERELEDYLKKQKEAQIKIQLDKIHKQQNKDMWSSPNKVLSSGTSILKEDRSILKEKNIFSNSKNIFDATHSNKYSMGFFK